MKDNVKGRRMTQAQILKSLDQIQSSRPVHISDIRYRLSWQFDGITINQVQETLNRLLKLGFIVRERKGYYRRLISPSIPNQKPLVDRLIKGEAKFADEKKPKPKITTAGLFDYMTETKNDLIINDEERIEEKVFHAAEKMANRKIAAIWRFVNACNDQGVKPTEALFNAIWFENGNDIFK